MWGLPVAKEKAEEVRKKLKKLGLLAQGYIPEKTASKVIFPLKKYYPGAVKYDFRKRERKKSLKELFGIGSFDLMGNVAVVYIPEELWEKRKEIGEQLLKLYKGLTTVYARKGKVEGEFRVRPLELIAGRPKEAFHREHGLSFLLDPRKVYFSPRQATERLRIAKLASQLKASRIGVFFAGIGPLAVYLEKFNPHAKEIYAIEKNYWAVFYMVKNLEINGCRKVRAILADVREAAWDLPPLDLLLMPLPKGSLEFLEEARAVLKEGGLSVIYVASKETELKEKLEKIKKYFKIKKVRKELQIGPREYRFVVYAEL